MPVFQNDTPKLSIETGDYQLICLGMILSRHSLMYVTKHLRQTRMRFWWPVASVVTLLIVINCMAFVLTTMLPPTSGSQLIREFALFPQRLLSENGGGNELSTIITFVSHAFLHGDLLHLGLNMVWLYIFGQPLAIRFGATSSNPFWEQTSGAIVFLSFYLSAAVFSGLVFALLNLNLPVLLVGASGAISAITAAAIRVTLRRYQPHGLDHGKPLSLLDWKILLMTIFYLGSNFLLLTPYGSQQLFGRDPSQIAWEAHVGGFLYGLFMFSFFDKLTTKR